MIEEDSKVDIHDLLENSFNKEKKDFYQFDLDEFYIEDINKKITDMKNKALYMVGENSFKLIYEFYKNLQEVNIKYH